VYNAYSLCANGSTCVYPDSQPQCQCAEGFTGMFCDVTKGNDNYQALVIGLSVMSAVIFIMLIGCCLYCCYTRRHQWRSENRRRTYEQTPSEYSGEAPEDVPYTSGDLKGRLTPQWSSEFTTPMYRFHDHTKPSHLTTS